MEKAENYLREYCCIPGHREDVFAFYIREIPVDVTDGVLIDKRDFSTVQVLAGTFEGRSDEEIRFRPGDIIGRD